MKFFHRLRLKKHLFSGLRLAGTLRKKGNIDPSFEKDLLDLSDALAANDENKAQSCSDRIALKLKNSKKRGVPYATLELICTLVIAIAAAALIRQTCFELYEIPTGSMRPTFKEKDRVYVSKSTYGINIPFTPGHLFFSPDRVRRGDDVVITAENLDLPDVDTVYFGIFPGKKRYTKRLVALPGDTVYFYGGDLYCLDKDGATIHQLQDVSSIPTREYLPFISSFEGRIESQSKTPFSKTKIYYLKHFNIPIGRLEAGVDGSMKCQIAHDGSWIDEFSSSVNAGPKCFGEFFGIKNFALCRALLPGQLPKQAKTFGIPDNTAVLWLELHHSPTLPLVKYAKYGSTPLIQYCTTYIPLHDEHLENLAENLYTARFVVKDNAARRYYFEDHDGPFIPLPSKVPDGCYEFYHGKAYSIGFGGTATELKNDHPLYPKSVSELAFWINFGIDFCPECSLAKSPHMPTRFAYFKDGNLFLMGGLVLSKEDPILKTLEMNEMARQAKDFSYFAFQDSHGDKGDPITPAFIKSYGLHIPERHYLLLGDNPAMSLDCRYFGTVHEDNLQGSPVLLFWPFGERFGCPIQPHKLPSIYTISLLLGFSLCIYGYTRRSKRKALRFLNQLKQERR